MTTQYTWTVTAMDVYVQQAGRSEVVFNVHWTCSGQNGEFSSSVYATCAVPVPTASFTPYANLTQSQVLGWIWENGVDKAVTEAAVETQIQAQINPVVETPPLPWSP